MSDPLNTLKSIVDLIEQVSLEHPQVETFLTGESRDLAALNFDNRPVLVWLEFPIRMQFTPGANPARLDLQMQFLDQVISDGVDLLEITSKCDMVAQWIMDQLNYNFQERVWFATTDSTTNPAQGITLANHSGQKWAGVRYDFTLEYNRAISACEVFE